MKEEIIIAQRYARAIYSFAEEKNKVIEAYDLLKFTTKTYEREESLRIFLESPLITLEEKKDLVAKILINYQEEDEEIENIIFYLIEKGRISFLRKILNEFLKIHYKKMKIVDVKGIFTRRLTDEEYQTLKANLEKRTGKEVNLDIIIDKKILGGGILKIGNQVIDGSLRKDLNILKQRHFNQEV